MRVFKSTAEAFKCIVENSLTIEDRETALQYIFLDSKYSFDFLKKELFKTELERCMAVERVIKDNVKSLTMLLKLDYLLTCNERQLIILNTLDHWATAFSLVKRYKKLPPSFRFVALRTIMLSPNYVNKFLMECKPSLEERKFILDNLGDNLDIACSFMQHIKSGPDRDIAFKVLFNDRDKVKFVVENCYLTSSERKLIFEEYGVFFRKQAITNFDFFYHYCRVFNQFLPTSELELFMQKLISEKYKHRIQLALEEIKFPKHLKQRLEAFYIMEKLAAI